MASDFAALDSIRTLGSPPSTGHGRNAPEVSNGDSARKRPSAFDHLRFRHPDLLRRDAFQIEGESLAETRPARFTVRSKVLFRESGQVSGGLDSSHVSESMPERMTGLARNARDHFRTVRSVTHPPAAEHQSSLSGSRTSCPDRQAGQGARSSRRPHPLTSGPHLLGCTKMHGGRCTATVAPTAYPRINPRGSIHPRHPLLLRAHSCSRRSGSYDNKVWPTIGR